MVYCHLSPPSLLPPPSFSLFLTQRFLPDGCPFYPLLSRKMRLDPSSPSSPESPKSKSPSSKSPSPPSPLSTSLTRSLSPLSTSLAQSLSSHTEYRAVFLGRIDNLTGQPNQSLINNVISKVLTTPTNPYDLVVRVGSVEVTLLAERKTRILGEFPYSSLCGCGQGTIHQTCFTIVSVHMTTGQTSFTCFVCEAVSSELANSICGHIAQGFSGDKT